MGKKSGAEKNGNIDKTPVTGRSQSAGKPQAAGTEGEKGSSIFLWIFIGINVAFAILFVIKFFWSK